MSNRYEEFYSEQYKQEVYGNTTKLENHSFGRVLKKWLDGHQEYKNKKFLEIGSRRGALQDIVQDYTGIDYADSVAEYYHKPFYIGNAEELPFRIILMFVKRIKVYIRFVLDRKNFPLYYKKLKANYEVFWQSDSDACNDLDPFPVILWFESRGCKCVSHPTRLKQFLSRTGMIEFRVEK